MFSVGENARGRHEIARVKPAFRTALIAAALLLTGPALAEAQAVGNRVEINGMQMYYEVSCDGDPLIVLHSAYMNIPSMGAFIPRLAETHRVYALESFRATAAPPT